MSAISRKSIILGIILLAVALISIVFIRNWGNSQKDIAEITPSPHVSPTTSHNTNPTPTPTPTTPTPSPAPPEYATASILSAGDCVIHDAIRNSGRVNKDEYDFSSIFDAVKPYAEAAHYSIISFEGAATNNRNDYSGFPMFNCPPEMFDAFKYAGFDMVNCSNNHQLDRKLKGMLETRQNIKKAGLEPIGSYDGEETRYVVKEINGIKIGFMSYTYGCNLNENALNSGQRYKHLSLIDEERMEKEISEMEGIVDITVIAMHWGVEYSQKPNEYQKRLANDMLSWGADIILGSHPHVVQPSEIIEVDGQAKYIIYSMGNFLSNQYKSPGDPPGSHKERREDGMMVNIEIVKDLKTNKTVIKRVDHIPTWLWRYNENGVRKYKILPIPSEGYYENNEYPDDVLELAYASFKRTMGLVSDYGE